MILDAYHSSSASFKKLLELMLLDEGYNEEEVLKAIITHIKKLNRPRTGENMELLSPSRTREPVRIYIDGAFDLIHSGHYNAIR